MDKLELTKLVTKQEIELLSAVATDLLTGNHLLGRKRSQEQIKIHNEFCEASKAVVREQKLTERQKTLIVAMGKNFYGGLTDMAEQLCIGIDKLKKALPDEPRCEVCGDFATDTYKRKILCKDCAKHVKMKLLDAVFNVDIFAGCR